MPKTKSSKTKRKSAEQKEVDRVLALVRKMREEMRKNDIEERKALEAKMREDKKSKKKSKKKVVEKYFEVQELPREEIHQRIHELVNEIIQQIETTGRPYFEIPSRSADNIIWDEERDLLMLGRKTSTRTFHNLSSVVDATRTARVLDIVHELIENNLHATKREVFYSDVNLFKEQKNSDKIIEDVAVMLKTTRDSTHVVASARGSAIGRVIVKDGGDLIDLTKMGTGGWSITPFLDQVEIVESDAEFILHAEKDAAVMRLAEAKFWKKYPCIILTGKGAGDIATRAFLRRLVKELRIPAFSLVDSDPYGHYIYSIFIRGSKKLSYESPFLATPELKLLGVLSRDLDEFKIPKSVRIPMEPSDIKRTKELINEPFVQQNKEWVKDLKLMLKIKEKAEIQAFAAHSFKFLVEEYLPTKLETGDWI